MLIFAVFIVMHVRRLALLEALQYATDSYSIEFEQ